MALPGKSRTQPGDINGRAGPVLRFVQQQASQPG
jgi:hypothetical protein